MRLGKRHLRAVDPFGGVEHDVYDPDEFNSLSVDAKGHRAQTRVTMRPEMYAAITRLLASGALAGTPLNSYGAFMRDAAYHQMHRLGTMFNDVNLLESAAQIRRLARIEGLAMEQDYHLELINGAEVKLERARDLGDETFLREALEVYEAAIENMREPYAGKLRAVLDKFKQQ